MSLIKIQSCRLCATVGVKKGLYGFFKLPLRIERS
jgi:hypothetical protein